MGVSGLTKAVLELNPETVARWVIQLMMSVVIAFELYLWIRFVPWYFFLVAAKAFRFIRPVGYINGSLLCLLYSTTTLTFNL